MSLSEHLGIGKSNGHGRSWPGAEKLQNFARSPHVRIPIPGNRPMQLATDRVRAAPALTPTLAGALGMGAIGLGMWGLFFPKSVARTFGLPANRLSILTLFAARELYTGYSLAADPTKSNVLWARVAGDALDLAVLGAASNPWNRKRHNARFALGAVAVITALDVLAAVRMSNVQRDCTMGARR